MIQTYCGNGKGKTTAAVGAAVRAAGSGMKVLFVQFLKNGDSSECGILKALYGIELLIPSDKYVLFEKPENERILKRSKEYNSLIFDTVSRKAPNYQMIIFDEILDIIEFGYINEGSFISFIRDLKTDCEVILTGHNITDGIFEVSDYISDIKEVKHPYYKGVGARRGIEY